MTLCWTLLFLTSAFLASAHAGKRCPPPPSYRRLWSSAKTMPRRSFSHLETVQYACPEGFTSAGGTATVQCVDGSWTKLIIKCEKTKANCSAPVVANAVRSDGHLPVYKQGDKVTIACPEGFQLSGARLLTCSSKGTWRPQPPQCVSVPAQGKCAAPGPVPNPNVIPALPDSGPVTSFNNGDRLKYTCEVGYVPAGGSRFRTCNDGQWTRLTLKCEPMMCGSAGEIDNGMFTYTGVEFGDTATAVCNRGYSLVGRGTRHCLSQGWDGRVPVCEAVMCPDPQETNAKRKDRREPPHAYRSVISYQCGAGTLVGQREIWCTEDGTWNTSPPTCQELTCPPPNVNYSFWTSANSLVFQYRQTISIQCEPSYSLIGPDSITCGRDGQWLPSLPTCRRNT